MTNPKRQRRPCTVPLPESINGFILLPIILPSPLPSIPSSVHILYLRRHEEPPRPPAISSTKSSRTIFVLNVPVGSTKETIRGLFASLGGRLEDVHFQGQQDDLQANQDENLSLPAIWDRRLLTSGATAHITFPNPEDVIKIFKTISKERRSQSGAIRQWGIGVENPSSSLGLQRFFPYSFLAQKLK